MGIALNAYRQELEVGETWRVVWQPEPGVFSVAVWRYEGPGKPETLLRYEYDYKATAGRSSAPEESTDVR